MNSHSLTHIDNLKVPIKIRVGSRKITLKELVKLKEGSVVELNKNESDLVDILVGDEVIAKGEIIESGSEFSIKIKEIKR